MPPALLPGRAPTRRALSTNSTPSKIASYDCDQRSETVYHNICGNVSGWLSYPSRGTLSKGLCYKSGRCPRWGHSRHSCHPGVSGSPQERTFGLSVGILSSSQQARTQGYPRFMAAAAAARVLARCAARARPGRWRRARSQRPSAPPPNRRRQTARPRPAPLGVSARNRRRTARQSSALPSAVARAPRRHRRAAAEPRCGGAVRPGRARHRRAQLGCAGDVAVPLVERDAHLEPLVTHWVPRASCLGRACRCLADMRPDTDR